MMTIHEQSSISKVGTVVVVGSCCGPAHSANACLIRPAALRSGLAAIACSSPTAETAAAERPGRKPPPAERFMRVRTGRSEGWLTWGVESGACGSRDLGGGETGGRAGREEGRSGKASVAAFPCNSAATLSKTLTACLSLRSSKRMTEPRTTKLWAGRAPAKHLVAHTAHESQMESQKNCSWHRTNDAAAYAAAIAGWLRMATTPAQARSARKRQTLPFLALSRPFVKGRER